MKEYMDLRKIVSNLTEEEYRYELTRYSKVSGENSQYKSLLSYLRTSVDSTFEETQVFIYGKGKKSAFKQLIYRSKDKIFELWLSKYSIINSQFYDNRAKEILALRKQLIQFDILCLRGMNDIGLKLVNQIIQKSKMYEYYDLLVFALYKRLRLSGSNSSIDNYQRQLKEIEYYEDCRRSFHNAEIIYKSLYLHLNEKKKIIEQERNIEKIVTDVEADAIRTKSKTIQYNYYILKAEMLELQTKYLQSVSVWEKLIQLVSSNKYLNSTHGLGLAYYSLARSRLFLFEFENSKTALRRAYQVTKYFDPNTTPYFLHLFIIAYHTASKKEIEESLDTLNSYLYS